MAEVAVPMVPGDADAGAIATAHPLQNSWTLWFDSKRTQKEGTAWEDNLQVVGNVKTVEEFWATQAFIKQPTAMEIGASYHFFKTGVMPMWEDPANKQGGKFTISLVTGADQYRLDTVWEELSMALIGEYLDEGVGEQITGCVLGKRRNMAKVSIWTKDASNIEALKTIGARIKAMANVSAVVEYFPHGEESHEPAFRVE